nr:UDP N acetylglucosamine transferase subunit [Hymenolepis microstoma]
MIIEILLFFIAVIIGCKYYATRLYSHGKCSTMLILGSGGHTAELLSYVRLLPQSYTPRVYVVASTDNLSGKKAIELEKKCQRNDYLIEEIPRAREVGQSLFSSFFTTSYAFIFAVVLVFKHQPQLVLCNGPGTCVPVCFVARLLHFICNIGLCVSGGEGRRTAVVFVESVCRTRSLSLSGRLLYHLRLAKVIVQWPVLLESYPRAQYLGLLS